jgi:large subunit ribosomal protein L4
MVVDIYNLKREKVGELELADHVFNAEVKRHLMHEVVRAQRAARRSGTACVKERNAVSGGGKKPYRQKGTGRARQGSRRAPNHVGGGVVHGPRPRSYEFRPPRNVRLGALRSALSLRAQESRLLVVEDFELEKISTRVLERILGAFEVRSGLLIDGGENERLKLSARNLSAHDFLPPEGLNVLDVLRHDHVVLTKGAALRVQEALTRARGGSR